jgi:hypothetical protein
VYYIPRLKVNIMSLGHLEEGGCTIIIKQGFLRIIYESGRLLTKVRRFASRLYIHELKVVQPVHLLAKTNVAS